jgi:TRAP-type C4-dicarboxylate transport system substrate-binding protein
MKNIILALLAVALCASAVSAADAPSPAVLAMSTKNGVTTVITTGRVQAEAAINADGSVTFQIYPTVTLLDSAGQVISTRLDTSAMFNVPLSADLVAKVLVEVKAAYDADVAAKAAAAAAAAAPAP